MEKNERIRETAEAVRTAQLPRWAELPDLGLYMDQVIVLMGQYLGGIAGGEDKLLTPSMVNNYVKMGLLAPPVKKKYTRTHLACLVMICVLKQVVSISIVRELIRTALEELSPGQLYETFRDYYEIAAGEALEGLDRRVDIIESTGKTGLNLLAASCAIRSQLELRLARELSYEEKPAKPAKEKNQKDR
jgi:hypothetical protein